jgi:hypothetical protein
VVHYSTIIKINGPSFRPVYVPAWAMTLAVR